MTSTDTTPTVLVIDDEIGPRESLRFLLKNDYIVVCADGVDRGLELLRKHTPDTVILDIRMPGRSGIEGLREIRNLDANVSVIMLTGYGALETAQDAVRHEANDYMEKPFDAVEMRRTVANHVARTRQRRQRAQQSQEVDHLRQKLTAELGSRERLAELGQASAEFVHDIRNAFTVVTGSTELLRLERVAGPHPAQASSDATDETLGRLDRTVRHCGELLDTWQRLIHQNQRLHTRVDLGRIAREVAGICQPVAQAVHARIEYADTGSELTVIGDPVQISRAITNIVQNAIQALPPSGGEVRLAVEAEGACARLRVSDNGGGIPPENLERVFHAEFTTKRARGSMGLGLFIVRKIVEGHGGSIAVTSEVGRGTTMTILLPLAPAAVPQPQ